MSRLFVAYTSLLPTIVQVTVFVLFPVVRSSFDQVTLIELPKSLPPTHVIVPVMIIDPVAHHATPVTRKVLGLVVVKFTGYVSVIVRSPLSGPLLP